MPAAIAAAGCVVASAGLLLAGPEIAVGLAAAVLVGLWWLEGRREGRRLREALLTAVALAVVANFVSSWLGTIGQIPAGALIRDLAFAVLVLAAFSEPADERWATSRLIAYAALAAVVVASLDTAGGLPAVVGARTYLLYPLLLLAPAWRMSVADRLAVARGMVTLLAALAVLGVVEVATRGDVLSSLGWTPNFADTERLAASPYFGGYRRATGGLGNFLEFGLLMNIGLLLARASLRGPARWIAMGLFSVAAILSWSRLSWALTVVIAAVPLGPIDEGRVRVQGRRLAGVAGIAVIAALLLAFGPSQTAVDRILSEDRVTQRSTATRGSQFSEGLEQAGTRLIGDGPGTQGSAAELQVFPPVRVVTDNGYLVWVLELGWLGLAAIAVMCALVVSAVIASGAWWALALVGILAAANTLFTAADSRVILVVGFIALRVLWPGREEATRPDEALGLDPPATRYAAAGRPR